MTSTRKKSTCSRSSATVSRSARVVGRLPAGRELRAYTIDDHVALGRRLNHVEPRHEQPRHPLLLPQQRAPRRFGWMRREYRLDAEPAKQRYSLLERQSLLLQAGKAVEQAAGLRTGVRIDVLPSTPDAMDLFGHVHDLEPGRERPDQLKRFGRWTSLGAHDQRHTVLGIALAATDCGLPIAFHRSEYGGAALVL